MPNPKTIENWLKDPKNKDLGLTAKQIKEVWNDIESSLNKKDFDSDDEYYGTLTNMVKQKLKIESEFVRLKRFNKMYENTILKFEGMNKDEDENDEI